ncbi:5'-methylthioadenosine/S-adenosylhomocysteine nucleosidase family protein [Salinimonas sediminis]|uniref:Purine phosphorylase n=1 Tax=Salinimonas sediminis TaxID=2303538 RepID=A0A346NHU0_9ALTE|nr:5'-methylthioadenosine/S-adenosylhomocysteine nucleosidase [Salinimonas sediminis]AXR05097.1 purine phosphorylase [Salinimonas sediminis]
MALHKPHSSLALLLYVLLICLLNGCASLDGALTGPPEAAPVGYGPKSFNSPGFTAIVVAYEPEMKGILARIKEDDAAHINQVVQYKGIHYRIGTYHDEPVIIFATGMSIANAALSMQMAFDYFPVKQVVYMGIAGAVNPQLNPGDVVVPERWYYHDESVYANPVNADSKTQGEYILPEYYAAFMQEQPQRRAQDPHQPHYKPFGFIHPDEVLIIKQGMDRPQDTPYFTATPRLLEAAQRAIDTLPAQYIASESVAKLKVGGNGVTGSVFMDNRQYRQWTREVFDAQVTEMESAAVGQVCTINEVDWVIIRAVSDLAGGQEGVNVEHLYDEAGARVGANMLFALLDELARQ